MTSLRLYVVIHQDVWSNGNGLNDITGDGPTTATSDSSGNLPLTIVWSAANPGKYDIIADSNGNAQFDIGEAVDSTDVTPDGPGGFFVVPEYLLGGLAALGACLLAFVAFKKHSAFLRFGR